MEDSLSRVIRQEIGSPLPVMEFPETGHYTSLLLVQASAWRFEL